MPKTKTKKPVPKPNPVVISAEELEVIELLGSRLHYYADDDETIKEKRLRLSESRVLSGGDWPKEIYLVNRKFKLIESEDLSDEEFDSEEGENVMCVETRASYEKVE